MIAQEKNDKVKIILSYRWQQNENVELHMIYMLKQFSLELDEAAAAASRIDIFNLDNIYGAPANAINEL